MNRSHSILGLAVAAAVLGLAAPALAEDVKLGILGDLTGPIESLSPPIVAGAQLAFDEVNAQGGILGGGKIVSITGDSRLRPVGCRPGGRQAGQHRPGDGDRRRLLHRRHHRRGERLPASRAVSS